MNTNQALLLVYIQLVYFFGMGLAAKSTAAHEDEPLKDVFKSFLPRNFMEKQINSIHKNLDKSKGSDQTIENMLHGLDNVIKGLEDPENGNCVYKCTDGAKPTAKPGYKVVPNGCGSHGFKADVSTLPGLTQCCNQHDVCYATCGKGQAQCDRSFNACLADSCHQMRKSGAIKSDKALKECLGIGAAFHLTVVSVGCQFYREAQAKACVCGSSGASKSSSQERSNGTHP